MATIRHVGRVSAVMGRIVMVDVIGLKPKFPYWLSKMRADLPPTSAIKTALNEVVAIELREGGKDEWEIVQTGLPVPDGMPPLPVHPVNVSLKSTSQKEVNNVGRYYAMKWDAGREAREALRRDAPPSDQTEAKLPVKFPYWLSRQPTDAPHPVIAKK